MAPRKSKFAGAAGDVATEEAKGADVAPAAQSAVSANMYEEAAADAAASGPTGEQLKVISELATRQVKLESEKADLEAKLKAKNAELARVAEKDLPDAMSAAGCKSFTTSAGYGINIKEDISASVPEARRLEVCRWLREHDFGDIVSDDVLIQFGKGEEQAAIDLVAELAARDLVPVRKTNVNTSTLKALVREQTENGVEMPYDILGITPWKKAIITTPK